MRVKFGDFIIAFIVLLAATLIGLYYFMPKQGEAVAVITENGGAVKEISLKNAVNSTFNIDNKSTFEIKDGKIRFTQSTCPDKICVNTGWISKSGQIAVCVPSRIAVEIKGQKKEVDVVLS